MYIVKPNPTQNTPRIQKKKQKINYQYKQYTSPPPASRAGLPGAVGVLRIKMRSIPRKKS